MSSNDNNGGGPMDPRYSSMVATSAQSLQGSSAINNGGVAAAPPSNQLRSIDLATLSDPAALSRLLGSLPAFQDMSNQRSLSGSETTSLNTHQRLALMQGMHVPGIIPCR
jgi:hypothetical protein